MTNTTSIREIEAALRGKGGRRGRYRTPVETLPVVASFSGRPQYGRKDFAAIRAGLIAEELAEGRRPEWC